MKVLIGFDGSPCAGDAVLDLSRGGFPSDADCQVLAAADVFPQLPPSSFEEVDPAAEKGAPLALRRARELARQALEEARELAGQGAARVRGAFPGWRVEAATSIEAPHWALVHAASEWRADVVVVGSHGRSAVGRAFLGSVSQLVLQHAPCSVRVARCSPGAAGGAQRAVRLVLCIDGSVDSATAASAVCQRNWPMGTQVLVLGVLDPRTALALVEVDAAPPVGDAGPGAGPPDLRQALDAVCEDLKRAGITATDRLLPGDPKKVILEEAENFAADCVFLGAKGHSRLERLLLGSVSASVAARAHCSVEVVR